MGTMISVSQPFQNNSNCCPTSYVTMGHLQWPGSPGSPGSPGWNDDFYYLFFSSPSFAVRNFRERTEWISSLLLELYTQIIIYLFPRLSDR